MRLSEIDFRSLEEVSSLNRWGAGSSRDRRIYRNGDRWYKVWGEHYLDASVYASAGQFHSHVPRLRRPHGFELGLFTQSNSPAFLCDLYDDFGNVRGYVTRAGSRVSSSTLSDSFVDMFFQQCLDLGWIYSDFCFKNLVQVDEGVSLIDFDTHLTKVATVDAEFERLKGALRPHVEERFRNRVESMVP